MYKELDHLDFVTKHETKPKESDVTSERLPLVGPESCGFELQKQ